MVMSVIPVGVWLCFPLVMGVVVQMNDNTGNALGSKERPTVKDPHLERPTYNDIRNLIRVYNEDRRPVCPCGLVGHRRAKRVIGGTPSDIEAHPYAVSIRKYLSNGQPYPYCGGTVITERHVVTASHCLLHKNSEDLTIELGRTNITGSEPTQDPFIRRVIRIDRHEHYDQPSYNNDIAILTLDAPLSFGRLTRPACLPPYGSDVQEGTMGQVVGWGRMAFRGKKSDILQNVTLPVVNRTECQRPLRHRISTNMLCAGGLEAQDACVGDSGGPFTVKYQSAPLLAGIVSFGKKCGLANVYGVYTRVGLYTRFIYEQTRNSACKPGVLSMRDYRAVGETTGWTSYKITQYNLL